jgi:hypothetical protein
MSRLEIIRAIVESYEWSDGLKIELNADNLETREELSVIRANIEQVRAEAEELNRRRSEAEERGSLSRSAIDEYNRRFNELESEMSILRSEGGFLIADSYAASKLEERITREAATEDDWTFVNRLAWEATCFLVVQDRVVKLMSNDQFLSQPPLRNLRFFYYPKGQLGSFSTGEVPTQGLPILSLSSPTPALWLPAGVSRSSPRNAEGRQEEPLLAGALLTGVNADERTASVEELNDFSELPARIGSEEHFGGEESDNTMPPPDRQTGYQYETFSGNEYDETVQRMAQAEFRRLSAGPLVGVQLEIETLGVPEIEASETVGVYGLGKMLDGNYGITKVEHRFENGGYTTTLSVLSNAMRLVDQTRGVVTAGSLNAASPQELSASVGTDTETETPEIDPEEMDLGVTT